MVLIGYYIPNYAEFQSWINSTIIFVKENADAGSTPGAFLATESMICVAVPKGPTQQTEWKQTCELDEHFWGMILGNSL